FCLAGPTPGNRTMKTYSAKAGEIEKKWVLINAEGMIVGRLASVIAMRLRGKHLPTFTPHMDMGDNVIVINADKVRVTGRKRDDKMYFRHSLYPGGHTLTRYRDLQEEKPEEIIRLAVKGMMPRNRLGRAMMKKLKIYAGAEHPHTAQQPKPLPIAGSTTGGE
ncbi:MAG TPA: 50S ribosomal protein L13, partial [Candidatus Eisenbacteria bacterium]